MPNITISNHAVRAGLTALATVALFSVAPATAQNPPRELVAYGDLDLTSDAGQGTLNKRIRAAVKRVCNRNGGSLAEFVASNRCKRDSLTDAHAQMGVAIARAGAGKSGIAANMSFGRFPTGKR